MQRAQTLAPDTIFASERERHVLRAHASSARWIVKRGAGGVTVDGVDHPALPVEVVDPTGAGDALAAGMLIDGPTLGLAAAARCCAKLGSMP